MAANAQFIPVLRLTRDVKAPFMVVNRQAVASRCVEDLEIGERAGVNRRRKEREQREQAAKADHAVLRQQATDGYQRESRASRVSRYDPTCTAAGSPNLRRSS